MKSYSKQLFLPVLFATAIILISFLIFLYGFYSFNKEFIKEKVIVWTTPAQVQPVQADVYEKQSDKTQSSNTGIFAIGNNARVYGTGNDGLRIRTVAGLNSDVLYLIKESELVHIQEGPVLMDGMIWWKVQTQHGSGWTVQNYLEILE